MRITRADVVGTLLALAAALICVRLGFWQLDRLNQRLETNALLAERMEGSPVEVTTASVDTVGLTYRRVELAGAYDHGREIVRAGRAHQGAPGVHVLTPLRLADGTAVLVNRGWLPSHDAATVDLAPFREDGPVRLIGLVLPFPEEGGVNPQAEAARAGGEIRVGEESAFRRVWYRLDGEQVRAQYPYDVAPFYVQALPDEAAPPRPARIPPPSLDRGPHLGYAIQLFSFATIAVGGWLILMLRRGGRSAEAVERELVGDSVRG